MRSEKTVFYGGWWVRDRFGRRCVGVIRCQAPDMKLYRANWEARKNERLSK